MVGLLGWLVGWAEELLLLYTTKGVRYIRMWDLEEGSTTYICI